MDGFVLEIVEGPNAGRQVELSKAIEIGRDSGCGLVLEDDLVSRHHARVSPQSGTVLAEDLGSRNGTYVNGNRLHGEVVVNPGDHLLLGVSVLEVRTKTDVAQRPTAVRPKPPAFAIAPRKPAYLPGEQDRSRDSDERLRSHRLDPLLDVRTKNRAREAPLGIAVLVTFAILLYIALH